MKTKILNKIKKLSSSISNAEYKGYIMSIAKSITNSDRITVNIDDVLKLVDPKRVEYDSDSAIGDITVDSKDF